jgi:hypothetical protein
VRHNRDTVAAVLESCASYVRNRPRHAAVGTALRTSRWHRFLLALLLCTGVGCGWSIQDHLPDEPVLPDRPPMFYRLDVEASSVEYRGNNSPETTDAVEVRDAVAELLQTRARPVMRNREPSPPARFRAVVDLIRTVWPYSWTIACIDLQVVGCPTGWADGEVRLELQVGDQLYAGSGKFFSVGGIYYNGATGTPRAIGKALEAAVASLHHTGAVAAAPRAFPTSPVPPPTPLPATPAVPPASDRSDPAEKLE